jgi:polyisoprenyl-phosphate glycosyltransferase
MKLSVIVPVYRGKEILGELFKKINQTLIGKYDFEVVFICDGCDSDSMRILKEIKKSNQSQIEIIQLAKNYGQHRALQYGFRRATGDLIITIDEDLQHDPADIFKLLAKQMEGDYDIVYGRFTDLKHNGLRNIISAILRKLLKHFIPELYKNYSPYRLIKKEIAYRASIMISPYIFIDDFLSKATQNITFVDIRHYKRFQGKSSYTILKLVKHGIYLLLAYSKLIRLLFVASVIFLISGLVIFMLSIIYPEFFMKALLSNRIIFATFGLGMILLILSYIGSQVNRMNSKNNTIPVILLYEDPI